MGTVLQKSCLEDADSQAKRTSIKTGSTACSAVGFSFKYKCKTFFITGYRTGTGHGFGHLVVVAVYEECISQISRIRESVIVYSK